MMSFLAMRELVEGGELSEEELFGCVLKQVEADASFMAWEWTYRSWEEAMAGRWRSSKGPLPLLGLPLGVKDIFNSQTGTTEMGSPAWRGHTAGNDARVLAEFIYQGACMVGKTTAAEFAVHALPRTLNPWDITVTPGTSSSGAAVAVALGHVPVALATQTAGSITRPASFTGTVGFKPTPGVYPRTGVLKTCDPFDTVGFICRYLEDIEPIFDATRVRGKNYPFTEAGLQEAYGRVNAAHPFRVARIRTPFTRFEAAEITAAVDGFLDSLPAGEVEVVELDLTAILQDADEIHADIYNKALSYYFAIERARKASFSPIMEEIFARGDAVTPDQYRARLEQLVPLKEAFRHATEAIDLICVASTATTAPRRGTTELPDSSRYWTMLHLPSLSVPLFISAASGRPFGAQLVGARKFLEPVIFRFLRAVGVDSGALKTLR